MEIAATDGYAINNLATPYPKGVIDRSYNDSWSSSSSNSLGLSYLPEACMVRLLSFHSSSIASLVSKIVKVKSLIGPHDQLAFIKTAGSFSVSQLSQILGVTRPSIYSWVKGSDIQEENIEKINRLYVFMKNGNKEILGQLSRLGNYRLSSGQSVVESLADIAANILEEETLLHEISPKVGEWQAQKSKSVKLATNPEALLSKARANTTIKSIG